MTRTLVIEPPAEEDILDAYLWYEERQRELGSRFIEELGVTFDRIAAAPAAFQEVEPNIRRSVTDAFPYLIFYTSTRQRSMCLQSSTPHRILPTSRLDSAVRQGAWPRRSVPCELPCRPDCAQGPGRPVVSR